jgi:hypothetical protein
MRPALLDVLKDVLQRRHLLAPVAELGADVAKLVAGVLLGGECSIRQAAVLPGQQAVLRPVGQLGLGLPSW